MRWGDNTMKSMITITAVAALLALAAPGVQAATLKECAAKWNEAKEAGTTAGQTYREFSKACMSGGAANDDVAQEEPAPKDKKKPKKQVVEVDDEDDGASGAGAQKKACDAKWKVHKASTGATGWKSYFTYMAKCM
jgi:hypothetical protein